MCRLKTAVVCMYGFLVLLKSVSSLGQDDLPETTDVLIVGAGAAGLAAASYLSEHGVNDITVVEAMNRVGGRINTELLGDSLIELGAQWIHGQGENVVFEFAQKSGELYNRTVNTEYAFIDPNEDSIFVSDKQDVLYGDDLLPYFNLFDSIETNMEDAWDKSGSVSDFVTKMYWRKEPKTFPHLNVALLDWYKIGQAIDNGADDLCEVSQNYGDYTDYPGNVYTSWNNGYTVLLDYFLSKIPDIYNIHLSTPVTRIDWNTTGKVRVWCGNHSVMASHVIVTSSLAYLQQNTDMFHPQLPEDHMDAVKSMGMGVVAKVFLSFPHRWWPDNLATIGLLRTSRPENPSWTDDIYSCTSVVNNPRVLSGWLSGASARAMEADSVAEVTNKTMAHLRRYLGHMYTIPDPVDTKRSTWNSNPWIRGAYSYRSVRAEAKKIDHGDLAEPLLNENNEPVVLFAGEATSLEAYSTVHGAVTSGYREAKRIIKLRSHPECSRNK